MIRWYGVSETVEGDTSGIRVMFSGEKNQENLAFLKTAQVRWVLRSCGKLQELERGISLEEGMREIESMSKRG